MRECRRVLFSELSKLFHSLEMKLDRMVLTEIQPEQVIEVAQEVRRNFDALLDRYDAALRHEPREGQIKFQCLDCGRISWFPPETIEHGGRMFCRACVGYK